MANVFLELIKQLNSSVVILLLLVMLAFLIVYKCGSWLEKYKQHEGKIKDFDVDFKSFSKNLTELTVKVDLIYRNTNPNSPVRSQSPLSLTTIGEEIVEKIDAKTIFNKYCSRLIKEVELANPKNAYDIQEESIRVVKEKMLDFVDEKELNLIKQEAFQRGTLVEDIMIVFGILLRNHILSEKNIPIADVDKHAPSV